MMKPSETFYGRVNRMMTSVFCFVFVFFPFFLFQTSRAHARRRNPPRIGCRYEGHLKTRPRPETPPLPIRSRPLSACRRRAPKSCRKAAEKKTLPRTFHHRVGRAAAPPRTGAPPFFKKKVQPPLPAVPFRVAAVGVATPDCLPQRWLPRAGGYTLSTHARAHVRVHAWSQPRPSPAAGVHVACYGRKGPRPCVASPDSIFGNFSGHADVSRGCRGCGHA